MEKKYDVTVAGHICFDIIPEIPDTGVREMSNLFKPGKLLNVGGVKTSSGGPVSNTGIALKKLGLNVAFIARIGDDDFGKLLINLLEKQGHTAGISISTTDKTSYTVAIAPPGIDRIFLHNPGANDQFSYLDINEEIIAQSKMFHLGYPPLMYNCYKNDGTELAKIFKYAKSTGAITSLDMSLPDPDSRSGKAPWRSILENILPNVDIFLPSIEEAFFMLDPEKYFKIKEDAGEKDIIGFIDPEDYTRLAEECLKLGAKIVSLKSANRGFYIMTNELKQENFKFLEGLDTANWSNRELWCPAFQIEKIASATGSGDSSIAGFLSAFFNGKPIEKALKYANCVGNQNLRELDAVSGIKGWETTTEMVENRKMIMLEVPLTNTAWLWDSKNELWTK